LDWYDYVLFPLLFVRLGGPLSAAGLHAASFKDVYVGNANQKPKKILISTEFTLF